MSRRRMLRLLFLTLLLPTSVASAQITLDGSLGGSGKLIGPNYRIGSDLGVAKGGNLFFSFRDFNIHSTESATFAGPGNFNNILARVTGGYASTIDGLLRSEIPGAHLYLLNPAGILFGANARLDVGGSFHASTANYLKFADGALFHASLGGKSALTVAAPVAFGFLGPTAAPITVQPGAALQVPLGETLSLVGGDIQVDGASLTAPSGGINLISVASAGEVRLGANGAPPTLEGFSTLGGVDVRGGSLVDASGPTGGTIVIRGGRLFVDGSAVFANTLADLNGAATAIDIGVSGDAIISNGSIVAANTLGTGNGGAVQINADTFQIFDSFTGTNGSSGRPGDITVNTGALVLVDGSIGSATLYGPTGDIVLSAGFLLALDSHIGTSTGPGKAGHIQVNADAVVLERSSISAMGAIDSAGIAIAANRVAMSDSRLTSSGAIRLQADTVSLLGSTVERISADDRSVGQIEFSVRDSLILDSSRIGSPTFDSLIPPPGISGAADIRLFADTITMTNSDVRSAGFSPGTIEIRARNLSLQESHLNVASAEGFHTPTTEVNIALTGQAILNHSGIRIYSEQENAGILRLSAQTISAFNSGVRTDGLFGSSEVSISASGRIEFRGGGVSTDAVFRDPGAITINAGAFELIGGFLANKTFSGNGADIAVHAESVSVRDSSISSETGRFGSAGHITLIGTDSVSVIDSKLLGSNNGVFAGTSGIDISARDVSVLRSDVRTNALSSGPAGKITLTGDTLTVRDSIIDTSTGGAGGGGGRVELAARDSVAVAGSVLSTFTLSAAPAGDVIVTAPRIHISDGTVIRSDSAFNGGPSGNVVLRGNDIAIAGGSLITDTNGPGRGGDISVIGSQVTISSHSAVTSNTGDIGPAGNVLISGNKVAVTGGSVISAASSGVGMGRAGDVTITASDTLFSNGGTIATSALSGDGGNITLKAGKLVHLENSTVTASVRGGAGTGGNITIDPDAVILNHSVIQANAFGGPGGNVTINAGVFLASPDTVISASSATNVAGTVAINALFTNISNAVGPLTQDLVSAATLLRVPCATRVARDTSRFVEEGRAGLPPEPGQALPSPLELVEMPPSPDRVVTQISSFTPLAVVSGDCRL